MRGSEQEWRDRVDGQEIPKAMVVLVSILRAWHRTIMHRKAARTASYDELAEEFNRRDPSQ